MLAVATGFFSFNCDILGHIYMMHLTKHIYKNIDYDDVLRNTNEQKCQQNEAKTRTSYTNNAFGLHLF